MKPKKVISHNNTAKDSSEIFKTKVTRLGNGMYGCRLLKNDMPFVEVRVKRRSEIGSAIKDMLRTMDKLGYSSDMALASRVRRNNMPINKYRFI